MPVRPRSPAIILTLGVALACQPSGPPSPLSQADEAAINAALDAIPREFTRKNADGIVAVFASNAVLLEEARVNRGTASILNDHLKPEVAATSVVKFDSHDRVIQGRGRMAYSYERFVLEANDDKGNPLVKTDSLWFSAVLEKQADGSWKLLLGHSSS